MKVRLAQDKRIMSNIIVELPVIPDAAFMDQGFGIPDMGGLKIIPYDHKAGNIFVEF